MNSLRLGQRYVPRVDSGKLKMAFHTNLKPLFYNRIESNFPIDKITPLICIYQKPK